MRVYRTERERDGPGMRTRIYYENQRGWLPADYYALFRHLNRFFLN